MSSQMQTTTLYLNCTCCFGAAKSNLKRFGFSSSKTNIYFVWFSTWYKQSSHQEQAHAHTTNYHSGKSALFIFFFLLFGYEIEFHTNAPYHHVQLDSFHVYLAQVKRMFTSKKSESTHKRMNESEREKEREKIKNEEIFENQPIDTYPV